jgi:4-alpha-glucanotransferase
MHELRALRSLARAIGVHTRYTDGLGKRVTVSPETLVRVCAAGGAPIARPADAAEALRAHRATRDTELVPRVLVAWDGILPPLTPWSGGEVRAELQLEDGGVVPLETRPLPFGYHRLTVEAAGRRETCTVIAAPVQAWRRAGRIELVRAQLAARSACPGPLGGLQDLETLCRWVREAGIVRLPCWLSTKRRRSGPPPVSRLFWSTMLDLGRPIARPIARELT